MITEKTKSSILKEVDNLIADGLKLTGIEQTRKDFRVFTDEEAGQVAVMFLDGPEEMQSWSGHLYEIKDEEIVMVEYGCFDFVDISQWPCFNYKELSLD